MSWTLVPKPTGANWTKINPQGKQQYDQSDILYDDPNVFYDSINYNAYTNVAKPTGGSLIEVGMATGVIGPPTYSEQSEASPWVKIPKPL